MPFISALLLAIALFSPQSHAAGYGQANSRASNQEVPPPEFLSQSPYPVANLISCQCRARSHGVTYLNHRGRNGMITNGKVCAYRCSCTYFTPERMNGDPTHPGVEHMSYKFDHVLGTARSFERWDYGDFTCHGQYIFRPRNIEMEEHPERFFEVRFLPFQIDFAGNVQMPDRREIGPNVYEFEFRYTKVFPELATAIRNLHTR